MNPTLTPQLYFDHTLKKLEKENRELINTMLSLDVNKGKKHEISKVLMKDIKNKTREINKLKLNFQLK
jgi:hypothetical protein